MNLAEELDTVQFKSDVGRIMEWIGNDPSRLEHLIHFVLNGTKREQHKSSWVLTTICDDRPEVAVPFIASFLDRLQEKGHHQGLYRSLIRIMIKCDLPEELHGRITEVMFEIIQQPSRSIAERAFAIHVVTRMVRLYPELFDEFEMILENAEDSDDSPAIRSSIRNARKKTRKKRSMG